MLSAIIQQRFCVLSTARTVTSGCSVYTDGIRGDFQDNNDEYDSMPLPREIVASTSDIQSMSLRRQHNDAVTSDEEEDLRAMDMPTMKDMTVPESHRDSIHIESFLTSEYCSRRFADLLRFFSSCVLQPHAIHAILHPTCRKDPAAAATTAGAAAGAETTASKSARRQA